MPGIQMIMCDERREPVPVTEALIVSRGIHGKNLIIGQTALRQVTAPRREGVACGEDEQGLDFYELVIFQDSVVKGALLFSIGEHQEIFLPKIEPQLIYLPK